jgi:hypothetical protein
MRQLTVLSVAMGTVAAVALGVSACGGGGGGSSSTTSSSSTASVAANVATAEVDGGPAGVSAVNTLYVTVTVCAPGSTTNCQTIPDVQVDTGSYGLRIVGSVLNATLASALTPETSGGKDLAECAQWADGWSWGPVVTGDLQIASQTAGQSESASSIPMQIIGSPDYPNSTVPADCTNSGPNGLEDTVATFGANGIIGVGPFVPDCGPGCASGAGIAATYYTCASPTTCTDVVSGANYVTVPVSEQVSNPIAFFAADNNGIIIELPGVPTDGSSTVTGTIVFGIGTETNNALGSATVLNASPDYGTITTVFNGTSLNGSYFDTGSNGLFFTDSSITQCTGGDKGFYCPTSTLSLSATVEPCTSANSMSLQCTGTSSTTMDVNFSVGNPTDASLFPAGNTAFNDLGGTLPPQSPNSPFSGVFDWGLPFFYGQNVYVAIACANDSGVANCATGAPFFAIAAQ